MTTQPTRARALGLIEKTILGATAGAAAAIGVINLVVLGNQVLQLSTETSTVVSGIPLTDVAATSAADASPLVTAASFDSLTMTVENLPAATRGYLIAGAVLGALVAIGVSEMVEWLCLRVSVGRPFVKSATWGIGIVAILVVAGGFGSPIFAGIAQAEILNYLELAGAVGLPAFEFRVDLAPLGWGLALIVVAAAFELGQRMQRDTEGLV